MDIPGGIVTNIGISGTSLGVATFVICFNCILICCDTITYRTKDTFSSVSVKTKFGLTCVLTMNERVLHIILLLR